MLDVAWNGTELFGVDGPTLYSINRTTAKVQQIGSGLGSNANALTFDPNAQLFGAGSDTLFRINKITGQSTSSTTIDGFSSSGDLAFLSDGKLVMAASTALSDSLIEINPTSGATRLIASTGRKNVYGLVVSSNTLVAATEGGELFSMNPATGSTLKIRSLSAGMNGLSVR